MADPNITLEWTIAFASGVELHTPVAAHDYLLHDGVSIRAEHQGCPLTMVYSLPTPSQHVAPAEATLITQAMSDLVMIGEQTSSTRTCLILIAPDHIAIRDAFKVCTNAKKRNKHVHIGIVTWTRDSNASSPLEAALEARSIAGRTAFQHRSSTYRPSQPTSRR